MSEELELTGASATRRRRILRGDLKVTPLRRLTYIDQYQGQVVLTPGRSRLDPTHPVVKRVPDLFVAAFSGDRATRDLLRDAIRRQASRSRRAGTRMRDRGQAPPRGRYRLPTGSSSTGFRLP